MTKTTNSHTPGPWAYVQYVDDDNAIIGPEGDERIAEMVTNEPPSVRDANARLIAAAPEMRNELNNVLHGEQDVLDLHAALNCKGEHCEFDELIETFARIRALLARIDGEES